MLSYRGAFDESILIIKLALRSDYTHVNESTTCRNTDAQLGGLCEFFAGFEGFPIEESYEESHELMAHSSLCHCKFE